jgi:hypothetical protein
MVNFDAVASAVQPIRRQTEWIMTRRYFWIEIALSALMYVMVLPALALDTNSLPTHSITYSASFKNIPIGNITLQLSQDPNTHLYHYSTVADPVWLARVVVSESTQEHSTFRLTDLGVWPLDYRLEDPQHPAKGTTYHYDWDQMHVKGVVQNHPINLDIPKPTFDPLSIRAQLLYDFAHGKSSMTYNMLDGDELKRFVYSQKNAQILNTEIGSFNAIVWDSSREHANANDRIWRYWLAPEVGFLPLEIEQIQDGKSRLRFKVLHVQWTDPRTQDTHVLGNVTPR